LDNFEWPYLRNGSRSTYIARIARSYLCDSTAFLLVVRMPFVSCCSRRLACSGRVSWSSKQVLPLRELMVLLQGGSKLRHVIHANLPNVTWWYWTNHIAQFNSIIKY